MPATVFLADDHPIVRQGLRAVLETERELRYVGEAGDGLETVRHVKRLKPDVLVMDLMLPQLDGLAVTKQVRGFSPRTQVVVLSMHSDAAYVAAAIQAGAAGYVVKEAGSEHLVRALREVLAGRQYFSPPLSLELLQAYLKKAGAAPVDPLELLSAREREVMQLSVEGMSSSQIGRRLFISPRTVESHRANLMRKLGVRNLKELIRLALEREPVAKGVSKKGSGTLSKLQGT